MAISPSDEFISINFINKIFCEVHLIFILASLFFIILFDHLGLHFLYTQTDLVIQLLHLLHLLIGTLLTDFLFIHFLRVNCIQINGWPSMCLRSRIFDWFGIQTFIRILPIFFIFRRKLLPFDLWMLIFLWIGLAAS